MTKINRREIIESLSDTMDNELIFWDGLDDAILGISKTFNGPQVVAYSYDRIIDILINDHEMSYDDAEEYFEFNIIGGYLGEGTPSVIYSIDDYAQE